MSHPWGVAQGLRHLGVIAYHQGDLDRAGDLLDESLVWWAKLGATRGLHNSLLELGNVSLARNEDQRAASYYGESLTLIHRAGIDPALPGASRGSRRRQRGLTLPMHRNRTRPGQRVCSGRQRPCARRPESRCRHTSGRMSSGRRPPRARLGEDRFASEWATGRAMGLEQAVADALGEPRSA